MEALKVYNLFDPADRKAAQDHVQDQIDQTELDLSLVAGADKALAEIEALLVEMRALAQSAARDGADFVLLEEKFTALKQSLAKVANDYRKALSPWDAQRIDQLLKSLGGTEKQA